MITVTDSAIRRFVEVDHDNADPDSYFVKLERAPQTITLRSNRSNARWRVSEVRNQMQIAHTSHGATCSLTRPSGPCGVEVSDGGETSAFIWFLRASVVIRDKGLVSGDNPYWPMIQAELARQYCPSHLFTALGLQHFFNAEVRYGYMVEIVGTVQPTYVHEKHIRFYLGRRMVSVSVAAYDAQNRVLQGNAGRGAQAPQRRPGDDDTSMFNIGRTDLLNDQGRIFDYDLPGSGISTYAAAGDRHEWNLEFNQAVVIGNHRPWPQVEANNLALSPMETWRARYTMTVVTPNAISGRHVIRLEKR